MQNIPDRLLDVMFGASMIGIFFGYPILVLVSIVNFQYTERFWFWTGFALVELGISIALGWSATLIYRKQSDS